MELARLHSLVSDYCTQYSGKQRSELKLKNQNALQEAQAEQELELIDLMGNTLLYEENHMIGFLPLRSYLQNRKQVG